MERVMTLLMVASLAAVCACDQKIDEGEDKLTAGDQSVEVTYKGMTQTVNFDDLETQYRFNEQPVVSLEDIVLGSGLVLSVDGLWLNFVGTDGYSPVCNENCAGYVPVAGEITGQGYIERGTRRLLWEESLKYPGCLSVKDVELIELAEDPDDFECGSDGDTDTDTDPPPGDIEVRYQGESESVLLEGLTVDSLRDKDVVLLTTLFAETSFVFDLMGVELSFEGADGYNPVQNGTCEEHLPAPGVYADRGGVNIENGRLEWHPDLGFAGCAAVKDLAIIFIQDI